jgi:hypothetical protein
MYSFGESDYVAEQTELYITLAEYYDQRSHYPLD